MESNQLINLLTILLGIMIGVLCILCLVFLVLKFKSREHKEKKVVKQQEENAKIKARLSPTWLLPHIYWLTITLWLTLRISHLSFNSLVNSSKADIFLHLTVIAQSWPSWISDQEVTLSSPWTKFWKGTFPASWLADSIFTNDSIILSPPLRNMGILYIMIVSL